MVKAFSGIIDLFHLLFVKKKGVGVAMIGLICITFVLTIESFSLATKVIATIFGLVIALIGLLMETPLLRHLKNEEENVYDFTDSS